ncbi:MAG: GspMb/PilO family protein [Chthoniobacteraceae bacterium]
MSRLNSHERFLMGLLAGALFVLGNWTLFGSFASRLARLKADIATKHSEIRSMQSLVDEDKYSAARDGWLQASLPKMGNPEQAGVQLLDQIKEVAKGNEVLLENPELGSVDRQSQYQAVSVQLTAKASWAGMVKFMHALQSPGKFMVLNSVVLQVDPSNAKQMSCRFRIAKWYAK